MSNLTSRLNWQAAQHMVVLRRRQVQDAQVMVADVELDGDNAFSIYCECDQIDKVPAALMRVIAPASLHGNDEWKDAWLDIIGAQAAEIVRLNEELNSAKLTAKAWNQLEAEYEALRAAAERYRWLRDVVLKAPDDQKRIWVHEFTGPILYGESIDDAIEAAVALEDKT